MIGAEHFVRPPLWEWWILGYFFFAGLSGGSYALGTFLRLWAGPRYERLSRSAFLASFPLLIPCPVFLTLDLGQPIRFWHMLWDTGVGAPSLKFWSPMSVGSWVLLIFGAFAFISFVDALLARRAATPGAASATAPRGGSLGTVVNVAGTFLGLFIAGYTGVLLSVSNQPVWSDGWVLGGLFLASAFSGSAAVLLVIARAGSAPADATPLADADRAFAVLEAALIVIFGVTLAASGVASKVLGIWLVLWLLVAIGLAAPLLERTGRARAALASPLLVLIGVLALRALVIFSAQT